LIVGFFAVALYQRDPPRSARGRSATGARDPIAGPVASRPPAREAASPDPARTGQAAESSTAPGAQAPGGAGPPPRTPVETVASLIERPPSEPDLARGGTPSPSAGRR